MLPRTDPGRRSEVTMKSGLSNANRQYGASHQLRRARLDFAKSIAYSLSISATRVLLHLRLELLTYSLYRQGVVCAKAE